MNKWFAGNWFWIMEAITVMLDFEAASLVSLVGIKFGMFLSWRVGKERMAWWQFYVWCQVVCLNENVCDVI